jgi:hypothetical protein
MFELYATGSYSLASLHLFLKAECGKVPSNAVSVYPTYRKPFDMVSERAKNRRLVGLGRVELPTFPI